MYKNANARVSIHRFLSHTRLSRACKWHHPLLAHPHRGLNCYHYKYRSLCEKIRPNADMPPLMERSCIDGTFKTKYVGSSTSSIAQFARRSYIRLVAPNEETTLIERSGITSAPFDTHTGSSAGKRQATLQWGFLVRILIVTLPVVYPNKKLSKRVRTSYPF